MDSIDRLIETKHYFLVDVIPERSIGQFRIHIIRLKVGKTVKAKPILIGVKHTVLAPTQRFPYSISTAWLSTVYTLSQIS